MTTSNLTIEQIEREVLRLGKTYPDMVYMCDGDREDGCFYTESDGEVEGLRGCLIGVALQKLGARPPGGRGQEALVWVRDLLPSMGIFGGYRLLTEAQDAQDLGVPWGKAVASLREKYSQEGSDV